MIETIRSQPRMRTIKKAIAELRTADPETDFSESRLRKMIASGEVPAMKQGKRYLVDLNVLYAVLGAMPGSPEKECPSPAPRIQRIGR